MANDDIKNTVQSGYDKVSSEYTAWTTTRTTPGRSEYEQLLLQHLLPSSRVLELGCGAGLPSTQTISQHPNVAEVIGNDISAAQLDIARARLPGLQFIHGDMMELDFPDESFDGIAAFFSILHLPREEQPKMLQKVLGWLKKGAHLVVNFGTGDAEEIKGQWFGAEMFWSSYEPDVMKEILEKVGFELLKTAVLDGTDESDESGRDAGIKFFWILAKKPS